MQSRIPSPQTSSARGVPIRWRQTVDGRSFEPVVPGQPVVLTGGVVAHNPFLVTMAEEIIGRKINVAEHPQLTGAIGAALYAMES